MIYYIYVVVGFGYCRISLFFEDGLVPLGPFVFMLFVAHLVLSNLRLTPLGFGLVKVSNSVIATLYWLSLKVEANSSIADLLLAASFLFTSPSWYWYSSKVIFNKKIATLWLVVSQVLL